MVARLLKINNVAIFKWIHNETRAIECPEIPAVLEMVKMDEMRHYINGKEQNLIVEGPLTLCQV